MGGVQLRGEIDVSKSMEYHIPGNFCGVLIFTIYVTALTVTKMSHNR